MFYHVSFKRLFQYGDKMNLYSLCKKIDSCDYPPVPSDHYSDAMRDLISQCIIADPGDEYFENLNPGTLCTLVSRATTMGDVDNKNSAIYNHHFQSNDEFNKDGREL